MARILLLLIAYTKKLIVLKIDYPNSKQREASTPLQKLNYSSIIIITRLMFFLDEIPTTVILRKDMKALVTE